MAYIQIPIPDFSFEDIAKDKAQHIIRQILYDRGLMMYASGGYDQLCDNVEIEVNSLVNKNEKLICIIELLNHLAKNINEIKSQRGITDEGVQSYVKGINRIKYVLYSLASVEAGYNFDRNAFDESEISVLDKKISDILTKLNEIQLGNEIIFNEVEELKDKLKEDFESLKSDYPLGKKRWYQRAAGVVVSYAGTKGADEVYEQLKPLLHDFFVNTAPHIIDKL